MSVEVFRQLGEELERRWQAKDYALGAFPELASDLLENSDNIERRLTKTP